MKSSILIATYLLRDTWQRWFEQPASVLARVVVTMIMASLAMILLVALELQILALEEQRDAFGLNRLVISEFVEPSRATDLSLEEKFSDLSRWGSLLSLKQLQIKAKVGTQGLPIMSYQPGQSAELNLHSVGQPVFLMTNSFPDQMMIDVEIGNEFQTAITVPMGARFAALEGEGFLFVPSASFPELEAKGFTFLHLLESSLIKELVPALTKRLSLDRSHRVEVRSSLDIAEKIDSMQQQQLHWRIFMIGILGSALALIYGVLAILEYRQNAYVSALIRSFGASSTLLALRAIIENCLIALASASSSVLLLSIFHERIFSRFGFESNFTPEMIAETYWGEESLWLYGFILVGVFLSCLPVALALRKPVGRILG